MLGREDFAKKLGLHLARLREAKGLSQSELARKMNRDRQNINKFEKGTYSLSAYILYLYELSLGLEVGLDEILNVPLDTE